MNFDVSHSQIKEFDRNGFLHVPEALGLDEVEILSGGLKSALAKLGKRKVAGGGIDWEEGDAFYDKVFTQRLNLWKISDVVKTFMFDPKLGEVLCQLAGVDALRIWHDQALIKEPHANPTAWHLDNPYWSFHSRHAITIWIALDDVDVQNGCLYFLPGSHKRVGFDNSSLGENFGELFDLYPDLGDIEPVPVPMRKGDCSFHNGLTAHCAGPNVTSRRRVAMTCAYMPSGSTFNGQKNILPDSYFNSLDEGDILDSDEFNPWVYLS